MSSEILGYDCDGKPLRAGDRVVVVKANNPPFKYLEGEEFTVVGPCPLRYDEVEIDALNPFHDEYKYVSFSPVHLRKIDQPELGDWSEIHKQTGWKPGKEERRETEKTT